MINHGRTLLANQPAYNGDFTTYVAEEFTPDEFLPLELTPELRRVRLTLFGAWPDRDMVNYRCRQLLTVLHHTPWQAYLLDLDSRITYAVDRANELVPASRFGVTVTQIAGGSPESLPVFGYPSAPDPGGRCRLRYNVTVMTSSSVRVARTTRPVVSNTESFAMTSGLSDMLPLVGSGYNFRLTDNDTSLAWIVEILNRPQFDLGTLLADVSGTNQGDLETLLDGPEPYRTFRNLWGQKELPGRLAGLVLGVVYRTNELWKESTGASR